MKKQVLYKVRKQHEMLEEATQQYWNIQRNRSRAPETRNLNMTFAEASKNIKAILKNTSLPQRFRLRVKNLQTEMITSKAKPKTTKVKAELSRTVIALR